MQAACSIDDTSAARWDLARHAVVLLEHGSPADEQPENCRQILHHVSQLLPACNSNSGYELTQAMLDFLVRYSKQADVTKAFMVLMKFVCNSLTPTSAHCSAMVVYHVNCVVLTVTPAHAGAPAEKASLLMLAFGTARHVLSSVLTLVNQMQHTVGTLALLHVADESVYAALCRFG